MLAALPCLVSGEGGTVSGPNAANFLAGTLEVVLDASRV